MQNALPGRFGGQAGRLQKHRPEHLREFVTEALAQHTVWPGGLAA